MLKWAPNPGKGFPGGSAGKESACNAGNLGLIPVLGRSPEEEKGYPLQYSDLEKVLYSPWGHKGSGTTERILLSLSRIPLRGEHDPFLAMVLYIHVDYLSSAVFKLPSVIPNSSVRAYYRQPPCIP